MHRIFISYSHIDERAAKTILARLEESGYHCWIDYRDALAGDDYAGSIIDAIKGCSVFVLILSKASNASHHVHNEIIAADNARKTIIPFCLEEVELCGFLEYYLAKAQRLDATTPPIEKHIDKLIQAVDRHEKRAIGESIASIENNSASTEDIRTEKPSGCRMMTFDEMISLGYTSAKIAEQLVMNDYVNCNGIGMENEGTAEQWEEYLQNNSDTFHYLVNDENRIVGDWSIVALNDDAYEKALHGELLEKDFDISVTEMICFPGNYNGYILTFSLLPEYRSLANYNMIVHSFFEQIQIFSENGIFFRRWCINVFGKEVEALIKSLGFRYVCNNIVCGKIYSLDFLPLPSIPLLKKFPTLVENYKKAND